MTVVIFLQKVEERILENIERNEENELRAES